jgi:RNA polymerase sigma-70 factor (ECF subfamily)
MEKNKESENDLILVQNALKGDMASLGLLFTKLRPSLYAHAIYVLGYCPQAEDAVSDTFVIAATKLGDLKKPQSFNSWLHAILKNVCRVYWRTSNKEFPLSQDFTKQLETNLADPEEFVDKLVLRDQLWNAIDALGNNLKTALMLRYFTSFYTYQEISQILQIPEGTVKSRLSEAKHKLKKLVTHSSLPSEISKRYVEKANFHRKYWEAFYQGYKGLRHYFSDNLLVLFPKENMTLDFKEWTKEIESDLAAESIFYPEGAAASGTVSVIEGRFTNSPKTPFRCPQRALAILFHPDHKVERVHVFLSEKETK